MSFFERVAKFHENMLKMDDRDFGNSLRLISRNMYLDLVGETAVRKSSKLAEIIVEFDRRIPNLVENDDYVNYIYFLLRLVEFDISARVSIHLSTFIIIYLESYFL